jgi:ribose transport system permease protein
MLTEYLGMLGVLVGLVFLFSFLSDHFFTVSTFATVANQIPDLTVIAVGMTFVLIVAGIDLSVGSVMAFSAATLGVAMVDWGWPLWAGFPLGMAVGLCCGVVNGLITVGWSVPSFIVTLGMLEIARGGAYLVTDSQTKYNGSSLEPVGAPIEGLGLSPAFILAVLVVVLGQTVLSRTVFGRYMIAIGTNEQAVRLSGIDPRPTKLAVFAIIGALSGLGGVFSASRLAAADPMAVSDSSSPPLPRWSSAAPVSWGGEGR